MGSFHPSRPTRSWGWSAALLGAGLVGVVVFLGSTTVVVPEHEAPRATGQSSLSAPTRNRPVIRPDEFSAAAITAITTVTATTPDLVLGAAVLDRKTGVDVLTRRHAGLAVSDRDVMLIGQALGPSADEAMNVLWTRFDGLGAVERVAQGLGLAHTQPPADPSRWGETLTSARDTIVLYRHVLDIMPPADRDLIMDGIATAPPIANDGFDLLSTQPRDVGYDQATATLTAAADAAQAALLNNRLAPRAPTSPGPTV